MKNSNFIYESEIIKNLKKQKSEIDKHPKLKNLSNLYAYSIKLHEYKEALELGILQKASDSKLPNNLHELITKVGEEHKNNTVTKSISECSDCNLEKDRILVKRNKLGNIERDE